ncbi:MAG: hypothetical protein AB7Q16_24780 [Vicinamibacterales bacterium]
MALLAALRGVLFNRNLSQDLLLDPTAIELVDDGDGPQIRLWDTGRLGEVPTVSDLAAGEAATASAAAAVVSAKLDEALATGAVIIAAAAENMTVLFPGLEPPTAEQKAEFAAAVKATAKQLLAAELAGGQ